MRRFKLLGLALVAVFAMAAAISASAFAVEQPVNLPESATGRTWTGEAEGTSEFSSETGEAGVLVVVKCPKAEAEGTEEAKKPLGLFHIHFLGCESEVSPKTTVKCTDLNHSTAGEILVLGTWHLVFDRKIGGNFEKLTTAILFLVEPVHFSCSSLLLAEVKGEVLCLHLKPETAAFTHSFHCVRNGDLPTEEWCMKGDNGKEECLEPLAPKLESNTNETKFRNSAEQALGNMTFKEEIFADI
ncbi:MAG TPA: hypothetical protein VGX69_06015 [Solirubrobacteraceae bacterium]|jgi:hypothetical protein|nr:hypothetical protein [Solirubrobacteraceae bacterium]